MNESIRQKTASQPQRQVGSVPVLFSVRNVQPKIVGAISQTKPSDNSATENLQPSPAIAASAVTATSVANPIKTKAPSTSNNRAYNVAVGLLVIALCLLVIRNTQSSKTDSNASIASNTDATPTDTKPLSNLKVELVPPALPNPTPLKPFDLNMESASSPKTVVTTVSSTSDVVDASPPSQSLPQAAPPTLLSSKTPESPAETTEAEKGPVQNGVVVPPLSFPAPSVVVDTGASQTNGNSAQPVDLLQANIAQPANSSTSSYRPVDTISPTLTSRELYEMKELHERELQELIAMRKVAKSSAAPSAVGSQPDAGTSVRATTVSNIAPAPNMPPASPGTELGATPTGYKPMYSVDQGQRDPSIMTGRAYSTAPQEVPSLTVPSYERDAFASRQAPPTATQNQMPIRQPSTKDGNRYPATTQTPYSPLPPVQNGSSFGYPPGK